jgi:hypothetical protein
LEYEPNWNKRWQMLNLDHKGSLELSSLIRSTIFHEAKDNEELFIREDTHGRDRCGDAADDESIPDLELPDLARSAGPLLSPLSERFAPAEKPPVRHFCEDHRLRSIIPSRFPTPFNITACQSTVQRHS